MSNLFLMFMNLRVAYSVAVAGPSPACSELRFSSAQTRQSVRIRHLHGHASLKRLVLAFTCRQYYQVCLSKSKLCAHAMSEKSCGRSPHSACFIRVFQAS
eukprot:TRINITY_DN5805_c0_g2_i1.p1 TRINITY_DN5805_c0_g2~~TRINITY_DN5805_c0_g2_i1.p1  ORF type:complete len:100 (+),score=5.18 TRINITY_DN5805_c0_g2_i1:13-312(+)